MNNYAQYIWPAYMIFALLFFWQIVLLVKDSRQIKRRLWNYYAQKD